MEVTKPHHVESILAVLVYIEANLDEPLLLSNLAKIAHVSPYYFHRLFHAYLSMTPREYIKQMRLTQSAKRLQYSHMSIVEVAFAMGYEDASSFTRAFSQLSGKSPRVYRKAMQDHLLKMNQKLLSREKKQSMPKPEYLHREEETVLFLRKTGDYREIVIEGIKECQQRLATRKIQVQTCYGMALDDPLTIARDQCRFDLCVVPLSTMPLKSPWGQKKLLGGKYAVFTHCGPFFELEEVFTRHFYLWHTSCKEKLRFSGAFCEYIDLIQAHDFSHTKTITAKYYVPLLG